MLQRSTFVTCRRFLTIFLIICCIILLNQYLSISSFEDEEIVHHKSVIYNVSDPLVITNLIDQFLYTQDYNERDKLWLLLVQSWLKSFESYLKETENKCSLKSSFNFIHKYLNSYTKKFFLHNQDFQRHLTGFGLFFYYDSNEFRSEDHPLFHNVFLSPCIYFKLIILIMKVQYVLSELNIIYFIGENISIGALHHHDIVPWHSIIEFNLPLNIKKKFLKRIEIKFQLDFREINDTHVNQKQIGFIYKIFDKNQIWPQIKIYFHKENIDMYPLHLRPFGPILLFTNPISNQRLNICESLIWDHQLEKQTKQWRVPCEYLYKIYSLVQTKYHSKQDYCDETIKTKYIPYETLSYFKYIC